MIFCVQRFFLTKGLQPGMNEGGKTANFITFACLGCRFEVEKWEKASLKN